MKTADAPNFDLIREVANHAALQSVQCAGFHVMRLVNLASIEPPLDADVKTATKHEYDPALRLLRVTVSMDVAGWSARRDAARRRKVIEAGASFELNYSVGNDVVLSEDALAQFAQVNGLYNAWPFLREAIYAGTARVGLPPLNLPLYRP